MKENKKMLGNGLLILTAMIWGTAFVFQRVGMESIEPITFNAARMALAAVAVGVVGMYLLCMTGSLILNRGDTLVCICAVLFSGHILCCDHFAGVGNPIQISAIQFATCTVISAVAALILEDPTWAKIVSAMVPILYCGIVSGGIGYTLQIVAQKFTDPTVASLLMSLESVFAVIAGALILGEHMTSRELLGCAIMFTAIVLVQLRGE